MILHAARKGVGRIARGVIPAPVYNYIWFYLYQAARGRFLPAAPRVEVLASPAAKSDGQALVHQLESINVNMPTPLCRVMKNQGSDKGLAWHNYTTVYHALLRDRSRPLRVFELGLGTNNPDLVSSMGPTGTPGASLRGWAHYLPAAQIYGADIDRDILFRDDRIATFYCDQLDPAAIAELWAEPELQQEFDLIIEDALHTYEANTTFLRHSLGHVRRGGYYVIEDILNEDTERWRADLSKPQVGVFSEFAFLLVSIPWPLNGLDNNMLIAHRLP